MCAVLGLLVVSGDYYFMDPPRPEQGRGPDSSENLLKSFLDSVTVRNDRGALLRGEFGNHLTGRHENHPLASMLEADPLSGLSLLGRRRLQYAYLQDSSIPATSCSSSSSFNLRVSSLTATRCCLRYSSPGFLRALEGQGQEVPIGSLIPLMDGLPYR